MDLLGPLDDEDLLRIGSLPMVPFCEALLDRAPKASSADLHEAWLALNPEAETPKAEFKRVRDAWKERRTTLGTTADAGEAKAQKTADAREQAWSQLEVAIASGNTKKQAELLKTLKALDSLAPERHEAASDHWELLTESQRACMLTLVRIMNGVQLDEDDEWFVALLARVPDRPYEVHPAHLPLPEANRPAMLTP